MTDMKRLCRTLAAGGQVGSAVSVAAAIWRNGRWVEALTSGGVTSRFGPAREVDEDTLFDLASLTKPITALTLARLARERLLDLGSPLGSHLEEALGTSSRHAPLELVLAHRAGIIGHLPLFRGLSAGKLVSRTAMLVEAASAKRVDAAGAYPGDGFAPEYSDLGYLLAGEVAARVAGRPLDAAMDELVFRPLAAELGSARQWRARDAAAVRRTAATEHVAWRGGVLRGVVHDENAWAFSGEASSGHAGLFGTARGALRVGQALIDAAAGRGSAFLTADELWPLVRPRPGGTLRAGFDGKDVIASSSGARFGSRSFGHLGFTGTSIWCDPDAELVGVLLTNRVHPSRDAPHIRKIRPLVYGAIARWAGGDR